MRNPLSLLLVVLVLFFGIYAIFFSRETEIGNFPSSGEKIVVFGDSLVAGVGSTPDNDLFSVLSRRIGEPIQNYGRGGDTTSMALERLPQVFEDVPNPKIAIILLGGNDFLRKVPKEETFSNLSKIIQEFSSRGSVVLLLGVRGGIFKDNFEREFDELRKEYKTAYVPNVLRGLITNRELMYDSIHPNDKGYQKIADRIYPVLSKLNK